MSSDTEYTSDLALGSRSFLTAEEMEAIQKIILAGILAQNLSQKTITLKQEMLGSQQIFFAARLGYLTIKTQFLNLGVMVISEGKRKILRLHVFSTSGRIGPHLEEIEPARVQKLVEDALEKIKEIEGLIGS